MSVNNNGATNNTAVVPANRPSTTERVIKSELLLMLVINELSSWKQSTANDRASKCVYIGNVIAKLKICAKSVRDLHCICKCQLPPQIENLRRLVVTIALQEGFSWLSSTHSIAPMPTFYEYFFKICICSVSVVVISLWLKMPFEYFFSTTR